MPVLPRRSTPARAVVSAVLAAGVAAGCSAPASDTPADTTVPASTAPSPAGASPDPDPGPGPGPGPDPTRAAYCATVRRVQQEQTSPQAGQAGQAGSAGGTTLVAAADAARRQVGDLAAAAPPEIAGDWTQLADLTDQALASLTATRGDSNRIDRAALTRLQAQSLPAVERIKQVTAQRCGIAFRPPA